MPAVVAGHEVRGTPVLARRFEKSDAVVLAVRGLHHVGERMRRPGVARVPRQRLTAEVLGALEVARLLEPEGVKAEDEACERISPVPRRQDACGGVAYRQRPAEKVIGVLRQPQGERVGRMIDEYRLPAQDRLRGLAFRPGAGGGEMAPLALRGAANRGLGRAERLDHLRMVAAKAADHVERRDRDAAERETWIARRAPVSESRPDRRSAHNSRRSPDRTPRPTRARRRASGLAGLWPFIGPLAVVRPAAFACHTITRADRGRKPRWARRSAFSRPFHRASSFASPGRA